MRIFLLYLAFLGTWILSSLCHHYYDVAVAYTITSHMNDLDASIYINSKVSIWVEAARTMIFTDMVIFLYLALDKKPKSLSYIVQLQHVFVLVAAKMVEHWFGFAGVLGIQTPVSPYHFNIANYILNVGYFIVTPLRVVILNRRKKLLDNEYKWT